MWTSARLTTADAKELASIDKDPTSVSAHRDSDWLPTAKNA
jgi:hypothetical protein